MKDIQKAIVNYKTIRIDSRVPAEDRLRSEAMEGWRIHSSTELFYPDGFVTVYTLEREEYRRWEQKEVNLRSATDFQMHELEGGGWIHYASSSDGNIQYYMRQVLNRIAESKVPS